MAKRITRSVPEPVLRAAVYLLLLLLVYRISQANYLVFHTGVEFISVIVSWSIFAIAINTHRYSKNNYFMFLGIAYAFIGSLDLLHAMAYKGMGIFLTGEPANLATQLWIVARFFEGASIFAASFYLSRTVKVKKVFLLYLTAFTFIILIIFEWENFPLCYNDGLTTFKIVCEYIISGLLIAGIVNIIRNRGRFQNKKVFPNIITAYVLSIAGGLIFTFYLNVYGVLNMAGHYLKLLSCLYIYEALVKTNLHLPHQKLLIVNERLSQEIAQREEAEARRLGYELELNKLSKLESIAAVAGGLAHDFKNLLTIIMGNADLARIYAKNDRVRKNLRNIKAAAKQGAELANRLLTFTKEGEPLKEPVDLRELIQKTTELALSGARVRARFTWSDHSPLIAQVDTAQICQVVNNIVINSIQAMPWGGFLVINLDRTAVDPESENLPLPPGEYIVIAFKDQGVGISKANLEQIFVPFFTTKKDGNGMGLATSFAIVKKHGGYITVASQRGRGTTFTVYLPAYTPQSDSRQEIAATRPPSEPD